MTPPEVSSLFWHPAEKLRKNCVKTEENLRNFPRTSLPRRANSLIDGAEPHKHRKMAHPKSEIAAARGAREVPAEALFPQQCGRGLLPAQQTVEDRANTSERWADSFRPPLVFSPTP
jgi:hypothetical protein